MFNILQLKINAHDSKQIRTTAVNRSKRSKFDHQIDKWDRQTKALVILKT